LPQGDCKAFSTGPANTPYWHPSAALLGLSTPARSLNTAPFALYVAAETDEDARRLWTSVQQAFLNVRRGRPGLLPPPDDGFEARLHPAERGLLDQILSCSVIGSVDTVRRSFSRHLCASTC
jgi:alkanesulfonate monooxygenase SsuD/methylene tetrahydromethanopterin reductase-like flavin-dependent oxidoreductase (luciferase family)